jgi:hypothetical protein
MTTLVIGGDRIDSIRRELADHGLDEIEHWGGRKPADARRAIPAVPGWDKCLRPERYMSTSASAIRPAGKTSWS